MQFRKATAQDIGRIMEIIGDGQRQLARQGVDQWQDGSPSRETICSDIEQGVSHLLQDGEEIIATVAITFAHEETYDGIFEGQWLSDEPYGVVHRIAVSDGCKGKQIAMQIMRYAEQVTLEQGRHSVKVDTHADNTSMQRLLQKCGYSYCGKLVIEGGLPRIGYEKLLT